jgi:hypothetical protein
VARSAKEETVTRQAKALLRMVDERTRHVQSPPR